jgi:hypothetical protein
MAAQHPTGPTRREPPPLQREETSPPTLQALDPATAEVGGEDVTLRCLGSGFTADSKILFNSGEEPTTLVNPTELTTIVKPSTASGPWAVPVVIDTLGTQTQPLTFQFTDKPTEPQPEREPSPYDKLVEQLVQVLGDATDVPGDQKLYAIKTAERRLVSPETFPS